MVNIIMMQVILIVKPINPSGNKYWGTIFSLKAYSAGVVKDITYHGDKIIAVNLAIFI
jgi:hypothetical protein